MKKNNIIGLIAAAAFATTFMAVPVMAQTTFIPPLQEKNYFAPGIPSKTATSGITKDQALDIALKQAGVAKKNAQYISVHKDYDDGREIFEVKFYVGMTEYNYDVDAVTGQIIDSDIDMEEMDYDFDLWDD